MPPIHKWERLLRKYLGQKLIFCLCSILDYDHEVFFFFFFFFIIIIIIMDSNIGNSLSTVA